MTDTRVPPNDPRAEQCVLGSMMLTTNACGDVAELITGADFYRPVHTTIYNTVLDLYARGEPTDPIVVANHLATHGDLPGIGGATYLHDLVAAVPIAASATYYAGILAEHAERRRWIEHGTRVVALGYNPQGDIADDRDRVLQGVHDATTGRETADLHPVGTLLPDVLAAIEKGEQRGLNTGLADLDRISGGMQPGQLWVIAARPSMGKTVVLTDIARSVALHQRQPVVFFSLEMGRTSLINRILAAETRIPLHRIKTGGAQVSAEDWAELTDHAARIADAPLHINDSSGLRITDISAKTRRLAARGALGVVIVDYLQLMEGVGGKANDNRERDVARISRGLKVLAKDLEIPVVVAAQLNRGPEQRADKRPMLSDLRESGAIEQDADVVILLHRDDYYDKESPRAGEVDLIVAKNRDGFTDTITAAAQLHLSRFVDMAI